MFRIVLIEDEPSAMRHLRTIIKLYCSGFEVVDTAENGADGLEKIRALKPDVVISDIKMPVMDGIKLASHVKEELPFIYSVIISGYQDFEYAKGAIQSGVTDYLLKPVTPSQLKELLESIGKKLEAEYYTKRIGILNQILNGMPVEQWQIERYLQFSNFSAAILRENGLPSRFGSKHTAAAHDPAVEVERIPDIKTGQNLWILPGRDKLEMVFLHTAEIPDGIHLAELVARVAGKLTGGYHTTIYSTGLFRLQDCRETILNLYRVLDNKIVIGLSQTINDHSENRYTPENRALRDGTLENRLKFLISNALYEELKQEFIKLFAIWEKEKYPQIWVENALRQIMQYIKKQLAGMEEQNYNIEFLLDEVMYYATSFGELMSSIWELVEKIIRCVDIKYLKVDNQAFFNSIEKYLDQNLCEPLTLQSVCAIFGISQTYLSRLFRKYKNMSFNEYLTAIRIEKAKHLITENPEMPLKDVAKIVGYNDQFYFSRVFRSLTGIPPSHIR